MAAGPSYVNLVRIAQKTPLPTAFILLGDVAIHEDRTENTVPLLHVHSLLR
jgi:hypothetical protein